MMVIKSPNWWTLFDLLFAGSYRLMSEQSDYFNSNLIHKFKAGDEAAFKLVFDQNFKKLYVFAFKMLKSREHAEEVVNDAFLNVWSNRDRMDDSLSITPYLFTVTKRLALNALRQTASSQKAIDNLWNRIENISNQTEEAILLNDLQRFTESKIAILPPQQQQIFKLSRNEGLSYEEIAEQLGISKNTVRNHLSSALKTLRKHLIDPNIFILASFFGFFEKNPNIFHISLVHLRF
ncbi:RNA polymerase sigma-70 factor [Mucilaginibacter sp. PAMB04168]|uniref:RNA polymerase sigma factor n=1 Tax=Mucilaginibacter sp. PAMB04168 TaxID=3138567 RepID=UPI0031F69FA6